MEVEILLMQGLQHIYKQEKIRISQIKAIIVS